MRFVSWNVNGLRAVMRKGFEEIFQNFGADFVCLQEIKLQEGQLDLSFPGYESYWHYAERKGYSGTAIFARRPACKSWTGIGHPEFDCEGRAVTLEYEDFFLVNVYTPNSQDGLRRIDYRCAWEDALRVYLSNLAAQKMTILCGDLNVAHNEIDLANPAQNHMNPGFSDQEREKFGALLEAGFVDSFRHFYPEQTEAYTWWSYRTKARERNVGWRIDYFVVSAEHAGRMQGAGILPEVLGSDHCPVYLDVN